jgi:hypothetical protein
LSEARKFDATGHNARHWVPPADGLGMRAKQRTRGPIMSYDAIQSEISESRVHWREFRKAKELPQPTYTKADKMVVQRNRR